MSPKTLSREETEYNFEDLPDEVFKELYLIEIQRMNAEPSSDPHVSQINNNEANTRNQMEEVQMTNLEPGEFTHASQSKSNAKNDTDTNEVGGDTEMDEPLDAEMSESHRGPPTATPEIQPSFRMVSISVKCRYLTIFSPPLLARDISASVRERNREARSPTNIYGKRGLGQKSQSDSLSQLGRGQHHSASRRIFRILSRKR